MGTQENYSEELIKQAVKFQNRIRADFHSQFAEIRDKLKREFVPADENKLAVLAFNELFHYFICLVPLLAADQRHYSEQIELLVINTVRLQFQAIRDFNEQREKAAKIQQVDGSSGKPVQILPETTVVKVAQIPGASKMLKGRAKKLKAVPN